MNEREFIELQRKAKNGIAWAQYRLGCYYYDEGRKEEAFFWYKMAADQGYGLAMYEVAESYYLGSGTNEDEEAAIVWYFKSIAKLEDIDEPWERECCANAYYRLGKLHDIRFNIPEKRVKFEESIGQNIAVLSINCYSKGSELGSGFAAYRLAVIYNALKKNDMAIEYVDRAIGLLEKEAVSHIVCAALSDSYFTKTIILAELGEDGKEVASLLGQASAYGHPLASYMGANINAKHDDIEGVMRCCENAIKNFDADYWGIVVDNINMEQYLKALDLCEKIITNLINGDSVEEFFDNSYAFLEKEDYVKETVNDITHESIYQLSLIAKEGNKAAISELWRQIKMLVPDEDFTAEIYRKTAPFIIGIKLFADSRNSSEAHYHLATCYHFGNGVDKSYSQAKDLYERAINRIEIDKQGTVDILKASIKGLNALAKETGVESELVYPVTYGNSTFKNFDEIIDNIDTNPDALGLYSHCSIFGIGVVKRGTLGFDGLFEAANAGCTDAILGLGRLYEIGYDFIARDTNAALQLYKYAYSLKNVDALHSLGFVLFNSSNKKEIGLSMMQKAAELGSKDASNQLELLKEDIVDVKPIPFGDIAKREFEYDEFAVADSMQLYSVNLQDKQAIKNAIVDVMENMKPDTYSAIMNQFRVKYLRRRKLMHFRTAVNFLAIFEELVKDGLVTAEKVNDYGVVENTLYILKNSKQKMKSTTLDWDDL